MSKSIKPLNVSPIIKGTRWALLGCGIVYGVIKYHHLVRHEMKARPIREQQIKKKYEDLAREALCGARSEIEDLAKDLEVTELPPGWDKDL